MPPFPLFIGLIGIFIQPFQQLTMITAFPLIEALLTALGAQVVAERGSRVRFELPQKSYSGKLILRLPPEFHSSVATAAKVNGKSINPWAAEILEISLTK